MTLAQQLMYYEGDDGPGEYLRFNSIADWKDWKSKNG